MENEKKNNGMLVGILIGIIIMLLVFVGLFATGTIGFKTTTTNNNGQTSDNNQTNTTINNTTDDTNDSNDYIKTTSDKVRINTTQDYNEYAEISIEQGNLVVNTSRYKRDVVNNVGTETKDETYTGVTKTFSIDGEKVKYITSMYYQPGANTYVVVLTESGNVYANNIVAMNKSIDDINNFKKTEYSNVQGIVKIDNSDSTANDPVAYYFGAVIDGKTVRMNFNW